MESEDVTTSEKASDLVDDATKDDLDVSNSSENEEHKSKKITPPPLACFPHGYPDKEGKLEENATEKDMDNLKNNPSVAAILDKIDKSLPVRDQIAFLYSEMGFDKPSKSMYGNLCDLTVTALSMDKLESIDQILLKAGINPDAKDGLKVKCKISEMINEFNKKNAIKRMKVVAFLREIKTIFSLE